MEQELNTKGQRPLKIGKNTWVTQWIFVMIYLSAIIGANLLTTKFGPSISILNAFLFIGLDLTTRDKLHEAWHGKGLVWKMMLLILTGSVLSWVINQNSGTIAIASFFAFSIASTVDATVYHLVRDTNYLTKVNTSNFFGAAADSFIFPTIAFGEIMPLITLGQFIAKVGGGFVWSMVFGGMRIFKVGYRNWLCEQGDHRGYMYGPGHEKCSNCGEIFEHNYYADY